MKILFSGHFDRAKNPERDYFLEKLVNSWPNQTDKFAVFNQSGTCNAGPWRVYNPSKKNLSFGGNYKARLKRVIQQSIVGPLQRAGKDTPTVHQLVQEAVAENKGYLHKSSRAAGLILAKLEDLILCLDREKPNVALLWNQFNVFHRLTRLILDARGIKVIYFHDGVLPGSLAFDLDGEMGESWVSREPQRMLDIDVDEAALKKAREFLQRIRHGSFNRHPQIPDIDFKCFLETHGHGDKPLIFFAGQNDWHAGILPDGPNRKLHSPVFASSMEALTALDEAADKLGAHIIYKPHPFDRDRFTFLKQSRFKNCTVISHTDINELIDNADVTVTIASQVCYSAVFRGRNCVLLGRNQIYGKNLVHELEVGGNLAELLGQAIKANGISPAQEEALVRHLAQLNRSYLFDYGTINNDFYERDHSGAAQFLNQSLNS